MGRCQLKIYAKDITGREAVLFVRSNPFAILGWGGALYVTEGSTGKKFRYDTLTEFFIDWEVLGSRQRSEEHTSELQSPDHLVCRLLLEKKKNTRRANNPKPWRAQVSASLKVRSRKPTQTKHHNARTLHNNPTRLTTAPQARSHTSDTPP